MDIRIEDDKPEPARNVLGEPMDLCCEKPLTGFYRNGRCDTGPDDHGVHTVCIRASSEFLEYSSSVGNDLSTPMTEFGFPGLQEGDRWCLLFFTVRHSPQTSPILEIHLNTKNIKVLKNIALGLPCRITRG